MLYIKFYLITIVRFIDKTFAISSTGILLNEKNGEEEEEKNGTKNSCILCLVLRSAVGLLLYYILL